MLQPVEHLGAALRRTLHGVGATSLLLVDVGRWVARSARGRVRFGRTAYVSQMVRIGVRSVGIVTLVCSAIGFILAMQMAGPLDEFG